ncbi:hypothetical protein L9F63_017798 [Diploptera punctata]|uniref:Uncharacterized protein n=1 Tax=Diploptera punctata TaxID=6984 RepID=A0AAD7ZXU1_DIPPU|nr:hypothetical protein L9F63_017798 [Diploptera punctata]
MGNHHSHDAVRRNSFGRSNSGTDNNDRTPTQLIPIDKLSKILAQKSLEEDSVQGITCRVFTNNVFPRYPDLSNRLFEYLRSCSGDIKHKWLSQSAFKQQAEKFLGIIADDQQSEIYVKMYAEGADVNQDGFRCLLLQAYRLAMDHYTEGPQTCKHLPKILNAIIESAFHRKSVLSVMFLSHWLQQHTPRLIVAVHRYVVHVLSTAYREAQQNTSSGLELNTPVLEKDLTFPEARDDMLPLSEVWLLSLSLPALYIQPSQHHSPTNSSNGLTSQTFIAKMLGSICPSHWTLLYNSDQHGLGANRQVIVSRPSLKASSLKTKIFLQIS